ncbi:Pentatricopeptide repeat-containing protein At5g27110 [Linum grandiflorum]
MTIPKLISLLKNCNASKSLLQAKLIHQKILTLGLQNNVVLCKSLINLYSSCSCYGFAGLVFRSIENPLDISLWNCLMAAYTKNLMYIEAVDLFQTLLHYPCLKPDCFTYPNVLKACGALNWILPGRVMHGHFVKSGYVFDVVIASSLVRLYAKCGSFKCAFQLFDEIPHRDVASWNTVISCCYQDGKAERALDLFEKMRGLGYEPNSVTLTIAISSCARLLDLEMGKRIHMELMRTGFVFDDLVSAALVEMYGKCGCLEMAKTVFQQMPKKTVVAWNSLISAHGLTGGCNQCIELLRRMLEEGTRPTVSTLSTILMACSRSAQLLLGGFIHGYIVRNRIVGDEFINSALIDLYFKCGRPHIAENVFRFMSKPEIVHWNVMISGYVTVGGYFEALNIYSQMKLAGMKPDAMTFSSTLSACAQLAALEQGKHIHGSIAENGLENNEVVMGALMDMYAKCGEINEAFNIFRKLPARDLISWTSMITAYGSHGQAREALKLFNEMELANVKPDRVTFLAVLSACSHAGLVDEGFYYFRRMINEYNLQPKYEHYSCLIDLLGRIGKVHEAYHVLQTNPEIRDDVELLSSIFSACCLHKEVELGEEIAKLLIEKGSDDPSTYISLSNMYASSSKWNDMRIMRQKMKELNMIKSPGCSWIDIDNRITMFLVEDMAHCKSEIVRECLGHLYCHMERDEKLQYSETIKN